ncbi:hypothetical protein [Moraxella lacunata]
MRLCLAVGSRSSLSVPKSGMTSSGTSEGWGISRSDKWGVCLLLMVFCYD